MNPYFGSLSNNNNIPSSIRFFLILRFRHSVCVDKVWVTTCITKHNNKILSSISFPCYLKFPPKILHFLYWNWLNECCSSEWSCLLKYISFQLDNQIHNISAHFFSIFSRFLSNYLGFSQVFKCDNFHQKFLDSLRETVLSTEFPKSI